MDKDTRNAIERATQRARKLLEEDFAAQLEGDFDVHRDGAVAAKPGRHLTPRQALQRERIVAAIEHKRAAGMSAGDAAHDYVRDAAFTTLNRFVALKMLQARELVQECITKGEQSAGYLEFCGMAPGLALLPDSAGYRLYIESLFDELSTDVKVLFDRRDPSSVLWPRRATFDQLLGILNAGELAGVWGEDETIGWFYQFFNGQDERRKMREESQAPRNSRELAIRNQFFTPRYVVQFLTDNTLGRIWYEMRGTNTALADRCDYIVRKRSEDVAPRAKKDPRDLRVLDPACGSGHFLLYAFDLLLAIYEEAHGDPESPKSEATGRALAEDYPNLDALRRALPGLILAHNLYGVDIDPRCAQIAQLALWMRAQKAYRDFGIGRAARAQIRRSNIVVAEPLVADEQVAHDFVSRLNDEELKCVFKSLVASLNLAGDLGILLRFETLVARPHTRGQTDDFLQPPEDRIRAALASFALDASTSKSIRRRLFVDDASYGVGLLGIAEAKYDAIVMNPPFGLFTTRALETAKTLYSGASNDIYACFVVRALELVNAGGLIGVLSSRLGFFLEGLEAWRERLLHAEGGLSLVLDLGYGVLDDALVETAAYVVAGRTLTSSLMAMRLLNERDKALRTREILRTLVTEDGSPKEVYYRDRRELNATPGRVVAYWLPRELLRLLSEHQDFGSSGVVAYSGLQTDDDYRFLRLWWEVDSTSDRWPPFAKGGEYMPFADDVHLVVNWADTGVEMKAFVESKYRQWSRHIKNTDRYFREGLTYTERTTSDISVRAFPRGTIFSVSGPCIQAGNQTDLELAWGVLCSRPGRALMDTLVGSGDTSKSGTAARHYRTRLVGSLPSISKSVGKDEQQVLLGKLRSLWKANLLLRVRVETHRLFSGLSIPPDCDGVDGLTAATLRDDVEAFVEASENAVAIDAVVARSFGLRDLDSLAEFAGPHPCDATMPVGRPHLIDVLETALPATDEELTQRALNAGIEGRAATKRSFYFSRELELACLIARAHPRELRDAIEEIDRGCMRRQERTAALRIISIAMGHAFGRWRQPWVTPAHLINAIETADPFAALPPRSPAMAETGSREALVDDPGHHDDIEKLVIHSLRRAHPSFVESVEAVLCVSIRDVLRTEFLSFHISEYSNSRRRAPIYWQLATPSASYSVWLYLHALTKDAFFRVQNEYAAPKLAHEERRLESLKREFRERATGAQRKELAAQETFVDELRAFLEEVKRIAPLWNPNFDDGVIINFAPLWRLVPHHKPWQKELKSTWDALCEGAYDWAHLAMHLWPERVVPKCAKDRSLAIAHGLADVFWVEGRDGKWTMRKTSTRAIEDLVRERTYPAVKSSLSNLLEAPAANGNAGRARESRRQSAAAVAGREV